MSDYQDALQRGNQANIRRGGGDGYEYGTRQDEEELNLYALIGFTDELGAAWHFDAAKQGAEPNHYPGPVPIDDVRRRLFNWQPIEAPIYVRVPSTFDDMDGFDVTTDADGNTWNHPYKMVLAEGRKGIVRSDNHHTLGVFKTGYRPHEYDEWLTRHIENLLDDSLVIGSAACLKKGAIGFVQVRLREAIATQDGKVMPYVMATTSLDGSIATTYGRGVTRGVCDNTQRIFNREGNSQVKIKHTANSNLKIATAKEALGLIEKAGEDYIAVMDALLAVDITDQQFADIIQHVWPMPKEEGRAKTMTETRWDQVKGLWNHDERVKPIAGTAWGVVNAFDTWQQHVQNVRGKDRLERNMLSSIDGSFDSFASEVLAATEKVLVRA